MDGLVSGSVIGLAALGVTLVFGVARFVNAAHGDFLTLGAYIALWLNVGWGFSLIAALAGAVPITVAIVLCVYTLVLLPLERHASVVRLIASIAIALLLRNLIAIAWGSSIQGYDVPLYRAWQLGYVRIAPTDVIVFGIAVGVMILTHFTLYATRIGKEMRAVADHPDLARVVGIHRRRVTASTWILAGFLATVAGVLLALKTTLSPEIGWNLLIPAFAAAVLGGLSQPAGALLGGFVIGLSEEFSTMFLASTYKPAVAFAVLAVMLLWRPNGLLGSARIR